MKLSEKQYVILTKDIPELNLPKDSLGIVTKVFTKEEREQNDPYIAVIQTVKEPDVAVAEDEIKACVVNGFEYAD